jgi:hypothetical protein
LAKHRKPAEDDESQTDIIAQVVDLGPQPGEIVSDRESMFRGFDPDDEDEEETQRMARSWGVPDELMQPLAAERNPRLPVHYERSRVPLILTVASVLMALVALGLAFWVVSQPAKCPAPEPIRPITIVEGP